MKSGALFSVALVASVRAQLQNPPGCPELPANINLGSAVPINPADVPPGCNDFEVLVARGTSEINFAEGGQFGIVVGDPVISNLTTIFPRARGYPVQYPASGANNSVSIGVADVVARLTNQSQLCPRQRFGLVGYSQGAAVVHAAANLLPVSIQRKVLGYVVFGDPYRRANLQDAIPAIINRRALEICAGIGTTGDTDPVCNPTGRCFFTHLTYIEPNYTMQAVDFFVERFSSTL